MIFPPPPPPRSGRFWSVVQALGLLCLLLAWGLFILFLLLCLFTRR